jgi:glycyl-tRNA synthetase beta chain
VTGATLDTGLQKALEEAIAKLPIPKVMSYQLETDCELPGWTKREPVRRTVWSRCMAARWCRSRCWG